MDVGYEGGVRNVIKVSGLTKWEDTVNSMRKMLVEQVLGERLEVQFLTYLKCLLDTEPGSWVYKFRVQRKKSGLEFLFVLPQTNPALQAWRTLSRSLKYSQIFVPASLCL